MKATIALFLLGAAGLAQTPVIRSDSRLVLVDSVVTDRRGNYIHGLTQKDFRVWEDGKEQTISTFSFQADTPRDESHKHYMVLLFDNSTSTAASQTYAREAASRFMEANAGPDKQMAVAEFGGNLRITQNFTADADRLKAAVAGIRFSSVSPNARGMGRGTRDFREYAARDLLGAIRSLAEGLSKLPGRKSLVLLSEGFTLLNDEIDDVRNTTAVCNRANVAVYPIDIRGISMPRNDAPVRRGRGAAMQNNFFQRGRGRGNRDMGGDDNGNTVVGPPPVLEMIARDTGGFMISNSNNLLGGFEKIGKEQDEYYTLGYVPGGDQKPGACHTLKVKVDRGGTVRFRTSYCDVQAPEVLTGTPTERQLEGRLEGGAAATVKATMRAPFFYVSENTARVHAALEIPGTALRFANEKGKVRATLNVVGIAYLPDGAVGARFSDSLNFSYDDRKQVDALAARPFLYEKQFEMASGKYQLKVVFSSGAENFGRVEMPLEIEPWAPSRFFLSGLALSRSAHTVSVADVANASFLDEKVPLRVGAVEFSPAGGNRFHKTENGFVYLEIYEPALATPGANLPQILLQMRLLDPAGKPLKDFGSTHIERTGELTTPFIPIGLRIPLADIAPGSYKLQILSGEAKGSPLARTADLEVEP